MSCFRRVHFVFALDFEVVGRFNFPKCLEDKESGVDKNQLDQKSILTSVTTILAMDG